MSDLAERWPLAGLAEVRDALLAAYDDPTRGYHDRLHLSEVLDRLAELSGAGVAFDPVVAGLAAWFHDAVYDGERDAEERSATWAEEALAGTAYADEVARLVRLTETHDPTEDDDAGRALCDADLAILSAGPDRYAAYVAGVRLEYAYLSEDDFAAGRAAVLRDLLGRSLLFHTAYGREQLGARRPGQPRARAGGPGSGVEAEGVPGRVEHDPDVVLRLVRRHRRTRARRRARPRRPGRRPRPRCASACPASRPRAATRAARRPRRAGR